MALIWDRGTFFGRQVEEVLTLCGRGHTLALVGSLQQLVGAKIHIQQAKTKTLLQIELLALPAAPNQSELKSTVLQLRFQESGLSVSNWPRAPCILARTGRQSDKQIQPHLHWQCQNQEAISKPSIAGIALLRSHLSFSSLVPTCWQISSSVRRGRQGAS